MASSIAPGTAEQALDIESRGRPSEPHGQVRGPEANNAATVGVTMHHCHVRPERSWRERQSVDPSDPLRILVQRWQNACSSVREYSSAGDLEFMIIALPLQPTSVDLVIGGARLHEGISSPGMALLTPAGWTARCEFRGAFDILHLFVPSQRLVAMEQKSGNAASAACFKRGNIWPHDPMIEKLASLLLKASEFIDNSGSLYIEGVAQAILARLIAAKENGDAPAAPGLANWRLRRVLELVEAELPSQLGMARLAQCAGLSRAHFASRFRVSTGMSPHDYVVHRRIQRAQSIMRETNMPLVEVAFSVGFQSQAHFTTVFRRLSGETPGRWRSREQCVNSHPIIDLIV